MESMKKRIFPIINIVLLIVISILVKAVYADLRTDSNTVNTRVGNPPTNSVSLDGKHACPLKDTFVPFSSVGTYSNIGSGKYSYVCAHCWSSTPALATYLAIDMGVDPKGGSGEFAVVGGTASRMQTASCGHAVLLDGEDGVSYLYCHMRDWAIPANPSKVNMGDLLGYAAGSNEPSSGNGGNAHLHIEGSTTGDHYHPNVTIGPLLDQWCGNNVCAGPPYYHQPDAAECEAIKARGG